MHLKWCLQNVNDFVEVLTDHYGAFMDGSSELLTHCSLLMPYVA